MNNRLYTAYYALRLHPSVARLAVAMQTKLFANAHKPGWWETPEPYLMSRLLDEVAELSESEDKDAFSEAADVANFAMMFADVRRRTG